MPTAVKNIPLNTILILLSRKNLNDPGFIKTVTELRPIL